MRNFILSSFLVAGAAIGSGVLALPIVAAKVGLVNTYVFILITYWLSYKISQQTLNVYQEQFPNKEVNAATLAKVFLGRGGLLFAIIVNILNMGLDCASYVNVGGDLTTNVLLPIVGIHIGQITGMLLFVAATLPVFAVGIRLVTRVNGVIFVTKMLALYLAIFIGVAHFNLGVFEIDLSGLRFIAAGASTFFCIWGMQMTLPVVLRMNNYNVKKSLKAVVVGLIIPGVAYFGWLLLIYSLIPRADFKDIHQVSDIINYIGISHPELPHLLKDLVTLFASITALTAFFSIGYSMMVFFLDWFRWENNIKNRVLTALLSFSLPVLVSSLFAKQFVLIYQQSNMFLILCSLVPIMVQIKLKKHSGLNWLLLSCGLLLVFSQLVDNFA